MKRSKKKRVAKRKLTIVKILPKDGVVTPEDLDRWHFMFRNNLVDYEKAAETGEVEIQEIEATKPGEHFITLVRVGGGDYSPTTEDLEQWRQVFEDAAKDPDFKIFTHEHVEVEVIDMHDIIAVES